MSKREKIFLLIILILLVVVLFIGDYNAQTRDKIKDCNITISQLHSDNATYSVEIKKLQDSILKLKKRDTIVLVQYREKIKVVEKYKKLDFIVFYDTLLNTNIAAADTFICFDSTNIATITKKLLEGERDSLLLLNCNSKLANYDSIVSVQDSIITNKDIELKNINITNSFKVKKLRKQRNGFIAATVVELAVIIGLISK